jgi:hypothetical protein
MDASVYQKNHDALSITMGKKKAATPALSAEMAAF